MTHRRIFVEKRDLLEKVLPEYELATDAPLRLEEMPGYQQARERGELRRFEAEMITEERKLKYKTIDADGNIYLVANPWARKVEMREDGRNWVVHPKPKLVMTYAEARTQAKKYDAGQRRVSGLAKSTLDY